MVNCNSINKNRVSISPARFSYLINLINLPIIIPSEVAEKLPGHCSVVVVRNVWRILDQYQFGKWVLVPLFHVLAELPFFIGSQTLIITVRVVVMVAGMATELFVRTIALVRCLPVVRLIITKLVSGHQVRQSGLLISHYPVGPNVAGVFASSLD